MQIGHLGAAGALVGILLVSACSAPQAPGLALGSRSFQLSDHKADPGPTHKAHANAMDRQFVTKASQANLEEVALGQLGIKKATSASVKDFARRMESDHSKSQQELVMAAHEADLEPPKELAPEAKATMERLSKLSGMTFDREYMKVMVMGHEKAVKLFSMEGEKGMHPSLESYSKKTLPVIEEHLKLAREILAQHR